MIIVATRARIAQFMVGMTDVELKNVQSVAVDWDIIIDRYTHMRNSNTDNVCLKLSKRAISRMPAVKELLLVQYGGDDEGGLPEGLADRWSCSKSGHTRSSITCRSYKNCYDLFEQISAPLWVPKVDDRIKDGMDVPKVSYVWGWRPDKLPWILYQTV